MFVFLIWTLSLLCNYVCSFIQSNAHDHKRIHYGISIRFEIQNLFAGGKNPSGVNEMSSVLHKRKSLSQYVARASKSWWSWMFMNLPIVKSANADQCGVKKFNTPRTIPQCYGYHSRRIQPQISIRHLYNGQGETFFHWSHARSHQ